MSATAANVQADYPIGWFPTNRELHGLELMNTNKHAFLLCYVIALRAQYHCAFNRYNLAVGEALIGDYRNMAMTEQEYRTAKKCLQANGFATFKSTSKGTVAKLADTRVFGLFAGQPHDQNNGRLTSGQRPANGRLTTTKNRSNKKNVKTEEEGAAASAVNIRCDADWVKDAKATGKYDGIDVDSEVKAFRTKYERKGKPVTEDSFLNWLGRLKLTPQPAGVPTKPGILPPETFTESKIIQ